MQRVLRDIRRALAELDSAASRATEWQGRALEQEPALGGESPRTVAAQLLEGAFEAREVQPRLSGFAGFLDGVQTSRVVAFAGGVPIVVATVAAVVRERVERRLRTWEAGFETKLHLYVPRQFMQPDLLQQLDSSGVEVVDTLEGDKGEWPHPHLLLQRAVHTVQRQREELERELAERWCRVRGQPLLVDGGLPPGGACRALRYCVGAVKSHNTLYATGPLLESILALPVGWRSPAIRVERHWAPPCTSWYLRLHPPAPDDPLRGLLRVEAALEAGPSLTEEADTISGWLLNERAPLALPDSRWPVLLYGIRDCEEWLRAKGARR